MGVALIVQGDDVVSNANGQGIFRRCGNPCIAGDILFVLRHRNLLFEGLSVVDHRIFQILARTLFLVPHGVVQVRPLCPDRVQVCAVSGNKEGIPSKVFCFATLGSGPAGEGVAGGGGEADICRRFHLCEVITTDTVFGANLRTIMVNKSNPGRCLGVVGGEDHIAGHLHGLTGLIDFVVCFVLPVQEPQVAIYRSQDRGIAAALVVIAVNRARLIILLYIGNLKGTHRSGEVGNQGYISKELGIRVEQRLCTVAVYGEPGAGLLPVIVGSDLFHQFRITGGILQRGAVGNAQRYLRTADFNRQINGCFDLGGRPLGIEGDVLGGHGLAFEYESIALTGLVIIPTSKLVTHRHIGRTGGFIAHTAQRLLKLQGLRLFRSAVVDEDNLVAVAGVVELGIDIGFTVFGTTFVGETGNGILILVGNLQPSSFIGRTIRMVENISLSRCTRQCLYIVVCINRTGSDQWAVKICTSDGHRVNIGLPGAIGKFLINTPSATAVDCWPLLRDIGTVFCLDDDIFSPAGIGVLMRLLAASQNAPQVMCVFRLTAGVNMERNGILIALVVHIHNGGAVTGDGLLLNGLSLEALIALGRSFRFLAGGAGLGFGFLEGIPIIIGILLPVDHSVLGFRRSNPAGLQGCRPADTLHVLLAQIPAVEGKARPGRSRRQRHGLAIPGEDGGHIVAALGIEGDPVTVFDDGVNLNGACAKRDGLSCGSVRVGAPAYNGLGGVQRQVHHLSSGIPVTVTHSVALAALGGMYNGGAVLAHEQDIAEFREHCIDPNGLAGNTGDRAGLHRDLILAVEPVPALEHSALLGGVAGYAEIFPIPQVLGPVLLEYSIHIEFVDVNHRLRLTDVALGNVFHAGLTVPVDVVCRAVGSAGAHRLFRLCFNRLLIRQRFRIIQCTRFAPAATGQVAALADLAIDVRRILCADLRAGAGLLFRLRVLLAGCAAIVRRGISVALRCRGVLAALGSRGVFAAVLRVALRCLGILAALGNRGVFAAVLCQGILAALGSRGVFAAVLRRDISVALRCRGRRRILRAFRCRCGLFLVFRRCSGFHSGCAGCALPCLHSLGGFRAAGCGLCEDAHGAQADQHANRQQHCNPSFHVYSPLLIIRNRFL